MASRDPQTFCYESETTTSGNMNNESDWLTDWLTNLLHRIGARDAYTAKNETFHLLSV